MVMLNCRVLKLEDLLELARSHEADLIAPVETFSLRDTKIEIGDEPSLMGVVNLSPDSWYRESVSLNTKDAIFRGKFRSTKIDREGRRGKAAPGPSSTGPGWWHCGVSALRASFSTAKVVA